MDSQENWNTLFLNHFHTEKSTQYVEEFTDDPEWKGINHLGDPTEILERLGDNQNAVIVLTEHYQTNGIEFFEDLGREAEEIGGAYKLNDKSLILKHEGSKVAIINGVEASYLRRDSHLVIAGLPLENEEEYFNLDRESLEESLRHASFAHLAHPFLGDFGLDMNEIDMVCRTIKESPAKLFIPYTFAYPINIDRNARGEKESKTDIYDLMDKYDAPMIVEHDHHVHLPSNLGGVGLTKDSAVEKLERGEIPLEEILDMRIIEPRRRDTFRNLFRAGRTFADQLPNYKRWKTLWKRLTFPYGREELESWRDKYYSTELEDINTEELQKRSRPLNQ